MNFKKSKSDKKMIDVVWEKENEDVFDTNGREVETLDKGNQEKGMNSNKNNDDGGFDFDDNFGDFGGNKKKKKENLDFGFDDDAFGDQFEGKQDTSNKSKTGKDDFNFDFEGNEEKDDEINKKPDLNFNNVQEDDPFGNNEQMESTKKDPNPSQNLDFDDPFTSNDGNEKENDQIRSASRYSESVNKQEDRFPENSYTQGSAGRKR